MFNPFVDPVHADPYPTYRWQRDHEPVARGHMQTADHDFSWYVFRYQDVCHVLKSPEFGREAKRRNASSRVGHQEAEPGPVRRLMGQMMLFRDPPHHTRLRRIVQPHFHAPVIAQYEQAVTEFVEVLLGQARDRDNVDLIKDFAMPVPVRIIANMLGIPQAHESSFSQWGLDMVRAMDAHHTPEILRRADESAQCMIELIDRVASQGPQPGDDAPGRSLIHQLEYARRSGELSQSEVHAMVVLLLVAGHETTAAMIGNIAYGLVSRPDCAQLLRERPDLLDNGILELARFDSSVQRIGRVALCDTSIAGVAIAQGEHVYAMLGSGNRDERQFAEPDEIILDRDLTSLRLFGNGAHFCLGSVLARLEFQVAARALVKCSERLHVQAFTPTYRPSSTIRSLAALPVELAP